MGVGSSGRRTASPRGRATVPRATGAASAWQWPRLVGPTLTITVRPEEPRSSLLPGRTNSMAARSRAVPLQSPCAPHIPHRDALIAWSPKSSFARFNSLRMCRPCLSASVAGSSEDQHECRSRVFNRVRAILQGRLVGTSVRCAAKQFNLTSSAP